MSSKIGIDLVLQDSKAVHEQFTNLEPRGPTPIGHRLDVILGDYFRDLDAAKRQEDAGDYFARKQIKPVNVIIITDGAPSKSTQQLIADFADLFE